MKEDTSSGAVERALSILELVADSKNGMTNADFSRRLKIPKSSASYVLRVLEKRGYLDRDTNGKYRLGLKLLSLKSDALTHVDVREVSKPILDKFLRKSRLAEAHLAVLDNGRAVYIEKVEAEDSFIKMDIWVGHRLPVHTTAIGKALVSYLPDDEITAILKIRGMKKKTGKSITTTRRFLAEAEKIRNFGFAIDDEENAVGVRCIAAPIFDAQGKVVAAIGTSSTILQIDKKNLNRYVELIKESARSASQQLGYTD